MNLKKLLFFFSYMYGPIDAVGADKFVFRTLYFFYF